MKPPMFLLNQQVQLRSFAGTNSLGEKIYTTINTLDPLSIVSYESTTGTYTVRGRFEPSVATDRQNDRQDTRYIATLFILGTDVPTETIIIFENNKYIVSECVKHYDLNGISYLEVLLS
jgi:hypothetical protein